MTMAQMESVHFGRLKVTALAIAYRYCDYSIRARVIHKCREWLIARKRRRPASSRRGGGCVLLQPVRHCAFAAVRLLPAGLLVLWVKVSYSHYSQFWLAYYEVW